LTNTEAPKGTDLRQVASEELTRVADEINKRPRKTLAWARPADLLVGEAVAASA
jgi:IS30 family transposase